MVQTGSTSSEPIADMTAWQGIGIFIAAYLALLARSAWKQGEMRQFLMSCALLAALMILLAGIVALTIYFDRR
jgi:hypothetical protein